MRALTLTSFGGLDGVVLTDVAEPEMPDDAVTVRVHAVALAKWDVTTTEGVFVAMGGMTTFPQVLGWDFAGVISSAGSSVAGWEPGDRVLGFSPQPWTGIGVIAELVVLPPSMIAALPAELDFIAGATLPVTSLTAQQIVDASGLRDGTAARVIGAAGAVGGVVVQLGRDRGARMIASVGSADFGRVRDLGAADAVDRADDVAAQVKDLVPEGVDVTIDLVGPAVWQSALAATRTGGRLITTSGPGSLPDVERGITALPVKVQPDAASLTSLAERYANRSLTMTTTVAGVFPLPRARQALEAVSRGKGREKYVLDLQQ
jgi:NADPH:quinone reductase-like Zn-dependent oxidoreductase